MALKILIGEAEQQVEKSVEMFTSETAVYTIDQLEETFRDILQRAGMKTLFKALHGSASFMAEEIQNTSYSSSRKVWGVKEKGVARIYGNGQCMVALHSYEVEKKLLRHEQRTYCPLIHVVGPSEQAKPIGFEMKEKLMRRLCRDFMEAETAEQRQKISDDIAKNMVRKEGYPPHTGQRILKELGLVIDQELQLIEGQLVAKLRHLEQNYSYS